MLSCSSFLMAIASSSVRSARVSFAPHRHSRRVPSERQSSSRPSRIRLSPHLLHSRMMRSDQVTELSASTKCSPFSVLPSPAAEGGDAAGTKVYFTAKPRDSKEERRSLGR
jgi:hypothetical protein